MEFSFYENFVESLALILSKALTNQERERVVSSILALQHRIKQLSKDDLRKFKDSPDAIVLCKHETSCIQNSIRGFLSSFFITFSLKYGLGIIPSILSGAIFKKPQLLYKLAGKDTVGLSLFLSCFISIYKAVLCTLRNVRRKSDYLNSFLAGMAAGSALFIDKNKTRRLMVALYLSTRTGHFVCRWLWKKYVTKPTYEIEHQKLQELALTPTPSEEYLNEQKQKILNESFNQHQLNDKFKIWIRQFSGVFLMALSSGQILYCFACEQDTLAKSYMSFLVTHSGLREWMPLRYKEYLNLLETCVNTSQNVASSKFLPNSIDFATGIDKAYPISKLLEFKELETSVPHEFVICRIQHPHNLHCITGVFRTMKAEFWRGLGLYGPLNAVMTLIFKGNNVIIDPIRNIRRYVVSTLRSAIFLTCYVTMAWTGPCLTRNIFGTDKLWHYFLTGFLSGLMVLIEVPNRRLELALYCLPRAVESFWNCGVKWKWWNHLPGGEGIYFCVSTGVLMCLYQDDPESIHEGFRKFMTRVVGVN